MVGAQGGGSLACTPQLARPDGTTAGCASLDEVTQALRVVGPARGQLAVSADDVINVRLALPVSGEVHRESACFQFVVAHVYNRVGSLDRLEARKGAGGEPATGGNAAAAGGTLLVGRRVVGGQ